MRDVTIIQSESELSELFSTISSFFVLSISLIVCLRIDFFVDCATEIVSARRAITRIFFVLKVNFFLNDAFIFN